MFFFLFDRMATAMAAVHMEARGNPHDGSVQARKLPRRTDLECMSRKDLQVLVGEGVWNRG